MESINAFNLRLNNLDVNLTGTDTYVLQLYRNLSQSSILIATLKAKAERESDKLLENLDNLEKAVMYVEPHVTMCLSKCIQINEFIKAAKLISRDENTQVFILAMANISANLASLRDTLLNIYKSSKLLNKMAENMNEDLVKTLKQLSTFTKMLVERINNADNNSNDKVAAWVDTVLKICV